MYILYLWGESFRKRYINAIIKTIEDAKFLSRSRNGKKKFLRKRKIHFNHLILLIVQGLSRSIQRELNSFYQKLQGEDFSIYHVSKSAFSQARAKLKPEAFKELNTVGLETFYEDAPWLNFRGYRLLAIDGSTVVLPKHKSVKEEFGETHFGPKADSPRSLARISLLYDVLNYTTIDGQIDSFNTSEKTLFQRHLVSVNPGQDLLLMDRGYPSLALLFQLQQQGIDYCIRMKNGWWKEVRKMLENGETDKVVTFRLPANKENKELLEKYNTTDNSITCRLVVVTLPAGQAGVPGEDTVEILCTSITATQKLPYECFAQLYHYRWNIEEGYKLYKNRAGLESFSGKTAIAVKQDFYAKIFSITTMAVMAFPIEEKIKKEQQRSSRKYPYKVNRTNALSMVKEISCWIFMGKKITEAIEALDRILMSTTEIVRKGRKNPRKKRPKVPPSMNYKQL